MESELTYNGLNFVPYIHYDEIQARIRELGKQISNDYKGKRPLLICVLNGAFPFASDLFREIEGDAEITFIRLRSYSGTQTTGAIKEVVGLAEDIENRHVILVEDIIDTGHTIYKLIRDLSIHNPADLKIATLLFKPEALVRPITPNYVGFNVPKKFIIGFGLDIDSLARNLKDLYILKEEE